MNRYEQRRQRRLEHPEIAAGYREMDAGPRLVEALNQVRTQQGLTTEELARRMGRRRPALSRLLHAEHPNPRFDTLAELLAALNLTAEVRLRRAHNGEPPIQVIEVDAIDPDPAQLTG